jgi:ABC-type multidrug transport system fused ATPase/permease subunit
VEARTAGTELEGWQQVAARSYGWQVSSILADFLHRARGEVAQLVDQIQQATNRVSADERLQARQRAVSVILKTFFWALLLVLVVLAGIAALGWVRWPFALWTGGVMLGLYIVVSLALFLLAQRDLFAEMNLRQSQMGELEAMQANLRTALQDVSRLSTAYGQLLSWCRVLGVVLRAPFGPAPMARPSPGQLFDGLPRSTQLGVADPGQQQAGDAVHAIQRRLYALGWMTQPWQDMVNEVAARLREEPAMLFRMPGIGTQSGLDHWSYAVASGRVQLTGADALWNRVEQMFAEEHSQVADALSGTVLVPGLGGHVAAREFGAAVTEHRPGRAAPFDASLFTHAATTAGRSAVAIDEAAVARGGLGYRAVVVQASDGLPPYDFAVFEPRVSVTSRGDDDVTLFSESDRRDVPPRQDMVF